MAVILAVSRKHSPGRQHYRNFIPLSDEAAENRDQIPPGMNVNNYFFIVFMSLPKNFPYTQQQAWREMTVVFCPSIKIRDTNTVNFYLFVGFHIKLSFSIGRSSENFQIYAVVLRLQSNCFAEFSYALYRSAINISWFIGSGDVEDFQWANQLCTGFPLL